MEQSESITAKVLEASRSYIIKCTHKNYETKITFDDHIYDTLDDAKCRVKELENFKSNNSFEVYPIGAPIDISEGNFTTCDVKPENWSKEALLENYYALERKIHQLIMEKRNGIQ